MAWSTEHREQAKAPALTGANAGVSNALAYARFGLVVDPSQIPASIAGNKAPYVPEGMCGQTMTGSGGGAEGAGGGSEG